MRQSVEEDVRASKLWWDCGAINGAAGIADIQRTTKIASKPLRASD